MIEQSELPLTQTALELNLFEQIKIILEPKTRSQLIHDVITTVIMPESLMELRRRRDSLDFFSYCLTDHASYNVQSHPLDDVYSHVLQTLKQLIGHDALVIVDDLEYPMEFVLSLTPWGRSLLATSMLNTILRNQLQPEIYWHEICDGPFEGQSTALNCLLDPSTAAFFLRLDQIKYLDQHGLVISALAQHGLKSGLSVAYFLAASPQGRDLLSADNYCLTHFIDKPCLNTIIQHGKRAGRSVAYALAKTQEGRAILAANDHELSKLITERCLNHLIDSQVYGLESVAFVLALTSDGRAILSAHHYHLAHLVDPSHLDIKISAGQYFGLTLRDALKRMPDSATLLSAMAQNKPKRLGLFDNKQVEPLALAIDAAHFEHNDSNIDINTSEGK